MEKSILGLINKIQFISMKVQMFHWNVTGKDFLSYHAFFEETYNELNDFKDGIAEFLRFKNEIAVIDFTEIAKIGKGFKMPKNAEFMLKEMLLDYKEILKDFEKLKKEQVLEALISEYLLKIEKRIFFTQSIIL